MLYVTKTWVNRNIRPTVGQETAANYAGKLDLLSRSVLVVSKYIFETRPQNTTVKRFFFEAVFSIELILLSRNI